MTVANHYWANVSTVRYTNKYWPKICTTASLIFNKESKYAMISLNILSYISHQVWNTQSMKIEWAICIIKCECKYCDDVCENWSPWFFLPFGEKEENKENFLICSSAVSDSSHDEVIITNKGYWWAVISSSLPCHFFN